jgi:ferritin-like metal-binding protein YciE
VTAEAQLRELFARQLADMAVIERRLVELLSGLESATRDPELRDAFTHHLDETRRHVERLDDALSTLAAPARQGDGSVVDAVRDAGEGAELPEGLGDLERAGAAIRLEHLEIALYEGLIAKAEGLEEHAVTALLWENLNDEKEALSAAHTICERLVSTLGPGSAMA